MSTGAAQVVRLTSAARREDTQGASRARFGEAEGNRIMHHSHFSHCRLPFVLLMIVWALAAPGWTMTAADDPDGDGVPGIAAPPPPLNDGSSGLVMISKDLTRCYFGLYRATQMTTAPWELFDRTVEAMLSLAGGGTRILLFTYSNQLLLPVHYLQEDGYAVYVRLLLANYQVTGRFQGDLPGLDADYLRQFDLIVHWHTGSYGMGQLLDAGVPILTVCPWQAHALDLGSYAQDHRMIDSVCVSESHGPTAGYVPGNLDFGGARMWTYALDPADDVLTLVRYRCAVVASESMNWGSLKSTYR
jgi:hypothetical protein